MSLLLHSAACIFWGSSRRVERNVEMEICSTASTASHDISSDHLSAKVLLMSDKAGPSDGLGANEWPLEYSHPLRNLCGN